MHELSLAESVVSVAIAHAAGRPVVRVELKVGHLRQVVPSALAFGFELVAQGTVVEGAELVIEEVPAAGACRACGAETPLARFPLACTACASLDVEVLRGEELLIEALEVEAAAAASPEAPSAEDGDGRVPAAVAAQESMP